jgi:hypothetical protein
MTGQIDDLWEFKEDIRRIVLKHMTGPTKKHANKAMEWVRVNINKFAESVDRDLDYFAKNVIPVGEKLDAKLEQNNKPKGIK